MSKERSRGILIQDDKVLLIKRVRDDTVYFVLPGGGVEIGETVKEACIREFAEETGLIIEIIAQAHRIIRESEIEYFFFVKQIGGNLELGGPELTRQNNTNSYEPIWVNREQIPSIKVLPSEVNSLLQA